jgi:Fic family protein
MRIMYTPHYTISHNLLLYMCRIEASKALIEHSPIVPAWESKFRDEARISTVFHGTHLEGNDLTREQTEQLVRLNNAVDAESAKQQSGVMAKDRDVQEVINYRSVLEWIDQWQDFIGKEVIYSEDILKTLHALTTQRALPDDQVGAYRKQQVVVRSVQTGEIAFRPPVSVEIPFLLEEFLEWLNSLEGRKLHPILRAAITHYELVRIHPFIEGNGRTARAFTTLVMYAEGYDLKRFFSLENYFDSDLASYYNAILSVQQSEVADLSYWLEYFCYGLAIELDRVKLQVAKLSKDLQLQSRLGRQIALSERQIMLFELLQKQGEMTSQDASRILPNVSVDTILRDLKDMMDKKIIDKHGVTKGVRYTLVN